MKKAFTIPVAVFMVCLIGMTSASYHGAELYDFYSKSMRIPIFTAFFTLGGFLLSLKTFILIKLKEDLYDSPDYQKRHEGKQSLNPEKTISYYGPLTRLGNFLLYCVLFSLITSVFQFSIGLVDYYIMTAICMATAASTLSMVFIAWWMIRQNLKIWFELMEKNGPPKK